MGSGTQSAFKKILTIATKWPERRAGQCRPRGLGGEQPPLSVPDWKPGEGRVRPLHVRTLLRGKDRLPKRGSPPSPHRGGRCEAKVSGLGAEGAGGRSWALVGMRGIQTWNSRRADGGHSRSILAGWTYVGSIQAGTELPSSLPPHPHLMPFCWRGISGRLRKGEERVVRVSRHPISPNGRTPGCVATGERRTGAAPDGLSLQRPALPYC